MYESLYLFILADTIGIGKVKMLINPPNRIQPSSSTTELSDQNDANKPKRAPRMRMKTVTILKSEGSETDTIAAGSSVPNVMIDQINCLNNQVNMVPLSQQVIISQPQQHPQMSMGSLTNSSGVNANTYSTPTSSIQQVLYSSGSQQTVPTVNSTGAPMEYTVATDYSMLMQSVAAASATHVGGTTAPSTLHPSFLQQHHHFSNLH